jgi:hypothetical protein
MWRLRLAAQSRGPDTGAIRDVASKPNLSNLPGPDRLTTEWDELRFGVPFNAG